ncbi:hypothetical protein [Methylomagnum sp.]
MKKIKADLITTLIDTGIIRFYPDKPALESDLTPPANVVGIILNGGESDCVYKKAGEPGAGRWSLVDTGGSRDKTALPEDMSALYGLINNVSVERQIPGLELAVTDTAGRCIAYKPTGGKLVIEGVTPPGMNDFSATTEPLYPLAMIEADYMSVPCYGQSLSRGTRSLPALSTHQPYKNVMLAGGVRTDDALRGGSLRDGFVDLIECIHPNTYQPGMPEDSNFRGETPISATLNELVRYLGGAEYDKRFVGFVPGAGNKLITQLGKGGDSWITGLKSDLEAAHKLAMGLSATHNVPFWTWTHGEIDYQSGTDANSYLQSMLAMQDDFAVLVNGITRQKFRPAFISMQVASHKRFRLNVPGIALAQFRASQLVQDIFVAVPAYCLEHGTDNLHLTNEGSRMLGHYYALCAKRAVFDRQAWKPLQAVSAFMVDPNTIDVKFHVPYGVLHFDATWVAEAANQGFDVRSSNNAVKDMITHVDIIGSDTVRLTIDGPVGAGDKITYGWGRSGAPYHTSKETGPRGNLRDNQGDTYQYVGDDGVLRRLDNYCVIFEMMI